MRRPFCLIGAEGFSASAVVSPCPRLRTSALTRVWHSARLSRSPSLASAGCVLPFRGQMPAFSDGDPLRGGGSRAEILALSKSPHGGPTVSALSGRGGFWLAADC
jgi:hypothetical protein